MYRIVSLQQKNLKRLTFALVNARDGLLNNKTVHGQT